MSDIRVRLGAMLGHRPRILTLSGKEAVVLELLFSHGEMYGLELVGQSDGQLKRGTVYVILGRMEEKGFVTSRLAPATEALTSARRLYMPTSLGRRVFDTWASGATRLIPEILK